MWSENLHTGVFGGRSLGRRRPCSVSSLRHFLNNAGSRYKIVTLPRTWRILVHVFVMNKWTWKIRPNSNSPLELRVERFQSDRVFAHYGHSRIFGRSLCTAEHQSQPIVSSNTFRDYCVATLPERLLCRPCSNSRTSSSPTNLTVRPHEGSIEPKWLGLPSKYRFLGPAR
jgi:hypothetical protein